ncbi:thiamine pyrophosphate-dependent dehydrogenase E1 component subunit alpha [Novosphingobium album (ex Liu et al. 2023)]|uniref:Thiamine pyrophosphate-dependent dehydrogenase E1 component subunit alpha n=1 Tax=Novosphingobium album (ex Liu et al. 2023) TaxID=3031130 RepID=A0ABT5WM77_9SPHN|nr:thiamine pyrophosphate-dependent dehydrogenase E1 component subunit alpha [Novosphingobium album (ex Liu et al. 2023)]MDE8650984.1 thiamine pyrophosphate-dependent dehydrogenase E1 component subunit alpha [Novosphingobium album (ex Liu et al. 2023)]
MAKAQKPTSNHGGLLPFYEALQLIRQCEERLGQLFADGEVPGFIHLGIGQEAVSVGVMSVLGTQDTIASTHRGHGHALAKGIPLDGFFAELLARADGVCGGRGGSMHVADMRVGMLGANGIVGAGVPIALGSALAHRNRGTGHIAVSFFGDGALAEGVLHESFNMAALWKLPVLFVCEANGWSEFSPSARQIAFDLEAWSAAYGVPCVGVDGNDVVAVAEAAEKAVALVRGGTGPVLLECRTTRVRGHFEGDAQKYRTADEGDARDPIAIAEARLRAQGIAESELAAIADEVRARIDAAVTKARASGPASFAAARADVYTPLVLGEAC